METKEMVVNAEMLDMPESLKNRIIQEENGKDIVLVMRKQLKNTDLLKNENRLLIPWGKVRDYNFLNRQEESILDAKGGVELKKWKIGYSLVEKWHSLVVSNRDNRLREGTTVNLWSFRNKSSELCFALER
ncbi:hypothetical protein CISIN_1g046365mg, partial [Citrus sinensis]